MLYTTLKVKDNEYKLRLNAEALVNLEKKLGTNPLNIFMEIANDGGKIPSLGVLLDMLHYALQPYNHKMTLSDTYHLYDEFIEDGHTMMDIIPVLIEVFKASGFFANNKEEEVDERKNSMAV